MYISEENLIKKRFDKTKPCQYTDDEMIERIKQGLEDVNKGLGVSVEYMRKLHPIK